MYKRLKKLYPRVSEEFIEKVIKHIEESEVLISHSHKLENITDEELTMYYEQINIRQVINRNSNDFFVERMVMR